MCSIQLEKRFVTSPALTQNSPIIESGFVKGVCVILLMINTLLCRKGA